MAKLIFAMNQSLDGYVDHMKLPPPEPALFRHWIEQVRGLSGSVYGRVIYGLMRYWDDDQPGWGEAEHQFAAAWRAMPKWVVSRTLTSVGPNATLVSGDVETAVRDLKASLDGKIAISGPHLAGSLSGLIDEYHLYIHPAVLGGGTPFFTGPRPPLRFVGSERIGEQCVRLSYVSA